MLFLKAVYWGHDRHIQNDTTGINEHCIPKSKRGNRKGKIPLANDTIKCIRRKHSHWARYMETRDSKHYRDYYMYKARNTVKTVPRKKTKNRGKRNCWNCQFYLQKLEICELKTQICIWHIRATHRSRRNSFCCFNRPEKAKVLAVFFTSVIT